MKLQQLASYLDEFLEINSVQDRSLNGLQVEASQEVGMLAVAVDASIETFRQAADQGANLLIVHHGLFWGRERPLRGPLAQRIRALFEANLSLYAAHLPLDRHPLVGNNSVLGRLSGLEPIDSWAAHRGVNIGVICRPLSALSREELAVRLERTLGGDVTMMAYGPEQVQRVGVLTGGGAPFIGEAHECGIDTYVTGERSHTWYHEPAEYGLNVIYAGHYATETVGVKALGKHLEERFGLAWAFVDIPTGL
jgi:dinuclear metal center YbgI/SA1388 family protein